MRSEVVEEVCDWMNCQFLVLSRNLVKIDELVLILSRSAVTESRLLLALLHCVSICLWFQRAVCS